MITNREIYLKANELCKKNNSTLVYLTLFGSELYGTQIEGKSDKDVRGIFIPHEDSLLTKTSKDSIHWTTGDSEHKNTNEDIDIDLWSIQKFLGELLPNGDVGAMDVLFSASNLDTLIYMHPCVANIFLNPSIYFHPDASENGCAYAINQAKKYGLKGTRLGVLKKVKIAIEAIITNSNININNKKIKLDTFVIEIMRDCYHETYCYYDHIKNGINILGKWHQTNISFGEFYNRINKEYDTFGQRAIAAEQNNGIDYKALSHAIRALHQIQEYYLTGTVTFPLSNKEIVMKVKRGEYDWKYLDDYISKMIDTTKDIISRKSTKGMSRKRIHECILDVYTRYKRHKTIYNGISYAYLRVHNEPNIPWESSKYTTDVDTRTRSLIACYLKCIEAQYNVLIIFATEAGSRRWGIADEQSDYDVRFLFIHHKKEYIKLYRSDLKTTIEGIVTFPSGQKVDFSGFDLTHFLPRFVAGNWNNVEWISNEGVYIETVSTLAGEMCCVSEKLMSAKYNRYALWCNYRGLAKRMLRGYEKTGELTLKHLFYIFRACVCKFEIELSIGTNENSTYYHYTNFCKTIDYLKEYPGNTSDYTEKTILDIYVWYHTLISYKKQFKYSSLDINNSEFDNIRSTINNLLTWCKYEIDVEENKPLKHYPDIERVENVFSDILNNKQSFNMSEEFPLTI